jgi:integrase/recombinase XerD
VKVRALKERTKKNARTKISPAAMRRLCDAPDQNTLVGLRDVALLHTLASSGTRISEAATLTVDQLCERDCGHFLLVTGKNQVEARETPLLHEAARHIQIWLAARRAAGVDVLPIFTSFGGAAGGSPQSRSPQSGCGAWSNATRSRWDSPM